MGRPALEVGPHQVAEFADFLLGIELGPEIQEVQKRPEAEAHHKVLAVIEGQDAAGMFFSKTGPEEVAVTLGGLLAQR